MQSGVGECGDFRYNSTGVHKQANWESTVAKETMPTRFEPTTCYTGIRMRAHMAECGVALQDKIKMGGR